MHEPNETISRFTPQPPWKLIKQADDETTRGKSRNYKMGQKRKMQAQANAENTSGAHDESPHGGGRNPPHIQWAASIFSICLCLYFLL